MQKRLLCAFYTTIAAEENDLLCKFLPQKLRIQYLRRKYDVPSELICSHPLREALRLSAGLFSVDDVYFDLDRYVASRLKRHFGSGGPGGVYCYEDGALETFRAAKELSLQCCYDLPIGYWRAGMEIQKEEAELNPEWKPTIPALRDSAEKLERKDRELDAADLVLVASTFTKQTLDMAKTAPKSVAVAPYGAPRVAVDPSRRNPAGLLKVLYVGSLSQRKGLSYLLQAVEMVGKQVELTLIGKIVAHCPPLDRALKTHRWISSLPHHAVLSEMMAHDVLVFPSLFEGFGLVILEAMAAGLPVITTAHTAGPDIITDGKDGFIVPIRSADAIAEKLQILAADRNLLAELSQKAMDTANRHTWAAYQDRVIEALQLRPKTDLN